ncbi:MAG: alpha-hydroxy-acid oxidizing protein [Lachnospiraceae bacterium]|nr:alpha-hydroxy-acid oxidizing protein [Lachnospiraceae bacterium]
MFPKNSDQITRNYMDSLLIETRYIDSVLPDSHLSLWGHTFDTPITTAALSHLNGTAPDGMKIYAEGAVQAGALHFVGMGPEEELRAILSTGAKTVKIVKPMADQDAILRELKMAEEAGCVAVGMDIDHSFSSNGTYDNIFGIAMKSQSYEDLDRYINSVSIPFVIKGVLSPVDAVKCRRLGAAGIVVSHHHGMVDYAIPPLMALPEIKKVSGEMAVFVDCGFSSGMDVYKALALGATAVSVGRHLMPLLKDGAEAVSDRIKEMDAELRGVMARTGIKDLASMDPTVIHPTWPGSTVL